MESAETLSFGGDWSPRISFSYGFAAKPRISSPAHSPIHDPEFEFSSLPAADLTPKWHMLSADELFCDGKLRVVDESSEFGMAEKGNGEKGISACRGNVGAIHSGAAMAKGEGEAPTIRAGNGGGGARAEAMARERARTSTNRGDVLRSPRKQEKERSPESKGDAAMAQKLEARRNASLCRKFAGSEDEALLEKSRWQVSTVGEDAVQKSVMGCQSRAAGASREDALVEIPPMEAGLRRQQARSARGLMAIKSEELRTPVKWREAASQKKQENEHSSVQLRRFSRNPRSASMAVGDFAQRNCVSLENSRCPSPSRSFSLPATTPPSPSASAISASSSSRRTSRFREFFRLRKPAPRDVEPCRIPRFFFPFFKAKEARSAIADKQALEQPCLSVRHSGTMKEQRIAATAKRQATSTLDQHNVHIARHPSQQAAVAKPAPLPARRAAAMASAADKGAHGSVEPAIRRSRQAHSMDREGLQTGRGRGDIVWIDAGGSSSSRAGDGDSTPSEASAKEGSHGRGSRADSAAGASARHHSKSLERPIPYTASVRVTPVLNVPSCITPSLRKAKPPSNLRSFSLERFLLGRGKTLEGYTKPPATTEGTHHHQHT